MNLFELIIHESLSSDENFNRRTDYILDYYSRCSSAERAIINELMICMCGSSFESLCEKAGFTVTEDGHIHLQGE